MTNPLANNLDPIQSLYLAALGRAPDATGYAFWSKSFGPATANLEEIEQNFSSAAEFQNLFANLSSEQTISRIYQNILSREPDTKGLNYWHAALESGHSISAVALGILAAALNQTGNDDSSVANNKLAIGEFLVNSLQSDDLFLTQHAYNLASADPNSVSQIKAILSGPTGYVSSGETRTFLNLQQAGAKQVGNNYTVDLGDNQLIDTADHAAANVSIRMGEGSNFIALGGQQASATYNIDATAGSQHRIFELGAAGTNYPAPSYIINGVRPGDVLGFSNILSIHNESMVQVALNAAQNQTEALKTLERSVSNTHSFAYGAYQGDTFIVGLKPGSPPNASNVDIVQLKDYRGPLTLSFKDASRHLLATEGYITIGSIPNQEIPQIHIRLNGDSTLALSDNFDHFINDDLLGDKHISITGGGNNIVSLSQTRSGSIKLDTYADSKNEVHISGFGGAFTEISGHNLSLIADTLQDSTLSTSIWNLKANEITNQGTSDLTINRLSTDGDFLRISNNSTGALAINDQHINAKSAKEIYVGQKIKGDLIIDASNGQDVNVNCLFNNATIMTGKGNDKIVLGNGTNVVNSGRGHDIISFQTHPGHSDTVIISTQIGEGQVVLSGFSAATDTIAFDVNRLTTDGTHGLIKANLGQKIMSGDPSQIGSWFKEKGFLWDDIESHVMKNGETMVNIRWEDETTLAEIADTIGPLKFADHPLIWSNSPVEAGDAILLQYKNKGDHTIRIAAIWSGKGDIGGTPQIHVGESGMVGIYDIVLTGQSEWLTDQNFKFV